MNPYLNSEITCRLPPLSLADRVLMCAVYLGSAATAIAAVALIVLQLTGD